MSKVTWEMVNNWLGTDTDMRELLTELANGEYTPKSFRDDVEMSWEEEHEDE